MNRVQTAVVAVVATLVLAAGGVLGYAAWSHHRDHRDYPQDVRDGFLVTCAAMAHGTNNDDLCHCALDRLEEEYSLSEFTQMSADNLTNNGPAQPVIEAVQRCGGSYIPPTDDPSLDEPPQGATPTSAYHGAPTTTSGDRELQRAIDAYKAAAADQPGDPYGPANGVFRYPEGGRWAEVNGDESCRWSIVDTNGAVVDEGQGDVVTVPAQVGEFRTEPRCAWAYLPEP